MCKLERLGMPDAFDLLSHLRFAPSISMVITVHQGTTENVEEPILAIKWNEVGFRAGTERTIVIGPYQTVTKTGF